MSATGERFAGAAALITGGAHGIGKACAVRFAVEGARCAVADLDGFAAEQVASSLGGSSAGYDRSTPSSAWVSLTTLRQP